MTDATLQNPVAADNGLSENSSSSPTLIMADIVMTNTIGLLMQNAVTAQQNAQTLNRAATAATCTRILSVIPMSKSNC